MRTKRIERREIPDGMNFEELFASEAKSNPDKQLIGVEEQDDGSFKILCDIQVIPIDVAEQCLNQVIAMKTADVQHQFEQAKNKMNEDLRKLEGMLGDITTDDMQHIINENKHLRKICFLSFLTIGFVVFMYILEVIE